MKLIILIFLFSAQLLFSQSGDNYGIPKCKLEYKLNTENLDKNKTFDLIVTNKSNQKIKVAKTFSEMRVQAKNTLIFNNETNGFLPIPNSMTDVCFLKYEGKFDVLKPTNSKIYTFKITDLYLVNKVLKSGNKYKFQLWFDMWDILNRKTSKKCAAGEFTSEPIIFNY